MVKYLYIEIAEKSRSYVDNGVVSGQLRNLSLNSMRVCLSRLNPWPHPGSYGKKKIWISLNLPKHDDRRSDRSSPTLTETARCVPDRKGKDRILRFQGCAPKHVVICLYPGSHPFDRSCLSPHCPDVSGHGSGSILTIIAQDLLQYETPPYGSIPEAAP